MYEMRRNVPRDLAVACLGAIAFIGFMALAGWMGISAFIEADSATFLSPTVEPAPAQPSSSELIAESR